MKSLGARRAPGVWGRGVRWAIAAALVVASPVACDGGGGGIYGSLDASIPTTPTEGGVAAGAGVGEACSATTVCRSGLACTSGTCAPCACTADGAACALDDECTAGEYCGPARTCTAGGTGTQGTTCASDASCARGLRCDLVGFSAQCMPEGASDEGQPCVTSNDCLGGLGCGNPEDGGAATCQPFPPTTGLAPLAIPSWPGETCSDASGPTQAYFRVPRGTGDGDFYRLPFPNDVRLTNGKINLTGHPTPGAALLGYDLVQRWFDDLTATASGFSAYATVLFRFSGEVDQNGTLKGAGALRFLDVTQPASPTDVPFTWTTTTDRNAYICNNWLGLRPSRGEPLTPGHTYAVVLSTSILDVGQQPIQVSPDLSALLATAAPTDPALAPEWPKYQPLRDWATHAGVPASSILDATVFTVGTPTAVMPKLVAAVAAADKPQATSWIRCGDAPSPCPQATGDRACGTPDPAFDELQALLRIPLFQEGTEPYDTPDAGGAFVLASDGTPQVQTYQAVCLDLTVPKAAAMPAGGWPLLVYAPGTGGTYRSAITDGVAAREASIGDGSGGSYHVAVLAIDQVETGPRRGLSQDSSDDLFYNFANPQAARGNPLQAAADQMSVVRFATGFDLAAGASPTGAEIKFGSVAFWGHSQSATAGGIAMPYTAGVRGAVLSGEGASVIDGLLGKQNPVDVADVLPVLLEEDPSKMGSYHPVLGLLQNDLDGVDPLNHARALVTTPGAAADQKHVFQPYGEADTYAPPVTEATFAIAAQLIEAQPPASAGDGAAALTSTPIGPMPLAVPLGPTTTVLAIPLTAVVRQYASDGTYDGHFVAYDNAAAEADVDHFLGDVLAGKVPKVGR